MRERPKVGDCVEFRAHSMTRTGRVKAVAVTGVHFLIEMPLYTKRRLRRIALGQIIRILPKEECNEKRRD